MRLPSHIPNCRPPANEPRAQPYLTADTLRRAPLSVNVRHHIVVFCQIDICKRNFQTACIVDLGCGVHAAVCFDKALAGAFIRDPCDLARVESALRCLRVMRESKAYTVFIATYCTLRKVGARCDFILPRKIVETTAGAARCEDAPERETHRPSGYRASAGAKVEPCTAKSRHVIASHTVLHKGCTAWSCMATRELDEALAWQCRQCVANHMDARTNQVVTHHPRATHSSCLHVEARVAWELDAAKLQEQPGTRRAFHVQRAIPKKQETLADGGRSAARAKVTDQIAITPRSRLAAC